jgi:hypothetical protein
MRKMKLQTDDMFYFFLNYLADKKDFSASDIALVVHKYWKYEKEWIEFNEYYDKEAEDWDDGGEDFKGRDLDGFYPDHE